MPSSQPPGLLPDRKRRGCCHPRPRLSPQSVVRIPRTRAARPGPMHSEPALRRRLLVSLATLLELSVRKMPSPMFEIWQRSTLTVTLNVVPPFWRRNLPALSTMQFDTLSVDAALTCANLSSLFTPVTPGHVDRARGLDRERVFTDVGPAEVLQIAAVVEVHAVDAVVAEDGIAQRRAVLHAEGRILALFLAAIAQRAARVVRAAAAVIRAAGDADGRGDRRAAAAMSRLRR